jgi:ribosomal protein L19
MSNTHNNRYDEIKSLLKKSRMLLEQSDEQAPNIAKDIEDKIDQDEDEYETADMEPGDDIEDDEDTPTSVKDKVQKYRISGGILALHGKGKTDTDITTDDKLAFQETMDEFVNEVSDLVDFNTLNVYPNNVDWSGKIIDEDIDFTFTIGEDSGIYINGDMVKVDNDFLDLINKLQQYYQKFKSKWSRILASRKKTRETNV